MNIVPYEQSFKPDVQNICIETASPSLTKDSKATEILLLQYCNYYLECVPQYCFVATDNNSAVGYILCTPDYNAYSKDIINYNNQIRKINFFKGIQCSFENKIYKKYALQYPAHLHIDLLEEYTRNGVGSKLITALIDKLKKEKIKGIMLSCASSNTRALNFYKKHGFRVLKQNKIFAILGRNLLD